MLVDGPRSSTCQPAKTFDLILPLLFNAELVPPFPSVGNRHIPVSVTVDVYSGRRHSPATTTTRHQAARELGRWMRAAGREWRWRRWLRRQVQLAVEVTVISIFVFRSSRSIRHLRVHFTNMLNNCRATDTKTTTYHTRLSVMNK